jgi:peptidoglycan/LPS O-acetylase OafA/YrhL
MIGIILGYILYQNKNTKILINKKLTSMLWITSIVTLIAISFGMKPLHSLENSYNVGNAFFVSFHRNSWALAVGWIIFACQTGSGGIVKWFLEWSIWQPLGRISLSFYLVQTVMLTIIVRSVKTPIHFSNSFLVN